MKIEFKKRRRDIPEPQLATMIDVFSILIIFLIAGTVMGNTSILVPPGLFLPVSRSKEATTIAPQISIRGDEVFFSLSNRKYSLATIVANDPASGEIQEIRRHTQGFLNRLNENEKSSAASVNLVADAETPYSDIYATMKVFRQAGFQSLLFIAAVSGATR